MLPNVTRKSSIFARQTMKKFLAAILLLCHINGSMLLPQIAEQDCIKATGQPVDDINSVAEYIGVTLGYDHTPDDEDDDNGQNFHIVKVEDYCYEQPHMLIPHEYMCNEDSKLHSTQYTEPYLQAVVTDIITPPPDKA